MTGAKIQATGVLLPFRRPAWQRRVSMATAGKAAENDPPATATDVQGKQPMAFALVPVWKATAGAVGLAVVILTTVIGGFYSLKSDIRTLEQRVTTLEKWVQDPGKFPAAPNNSATPPPDPAPPPPSAVPPPIAGAAGMVVRDEKGQVLRGPDGRVLVQPAAVPPGSAQSP